MLGDGKRLRRGGPGEQALKPGFIQPAPAEEGIDRDHVGPGTRLWSIGAVDSNQEVPREAHSPRSHPYAARDLAVDEGQRDRNAQLAAQHVGQEAVARVVVVELVAAEVEGSVKITRDLVGLLLRSEQGQVAVAE